MKYNRAASFLREDQLPGKDLVRSWHEGQDESANPHKTYASETVEDQKPIASEFLAATRNILKPQTKRHPGSARPQVQRIPHSHIIPIDRAWGSFFLGSHARQNRCHAEPTSHSIYVLASMDSGSVHPCLWKRPFYQVGFPPKSTNLPFFILPIGKLASKKEQASASEIKEEVLGQPIPIQSICSRVVWPGWWKAIDAPSGSEEGRKAIIASGSPYWRAGVHTLIKPVFVFDRIPAQTLRMLVSWSNWIQRDTRTYSIPMRRSFKAKLSSITRHGWCRAKDL